MGGTGKALFLIFLMCMMVIQFYIQKPADACVLNEVYKRSTDAEYIANLTIIVNSGNTFRLQIAQMLANAWKQLGFNVSVEELSWPNFLDGIMNPNSFEVYIIGWAPDYLDPDDYVYPLLYGGTVFQDINVSQASSADEVTNYLSSAKVFSVENNWYVVVGPTGSGAVVDIPWLF